MNHLVNLNSKYNISTCPFSRGCKRFGEVHYANQIFPDMLQWLEVPRIFFALLLSGYLDWHISDFELAVICLKYSRIVAWKSKRRTFCMRTKLQLSNFCKANIISIREDLRTDFRIAKVLTLLHNYTIPSCLPVARKSRVLTFVKM